jgi:hypothetical protein
MKIDELIRRRFRELEEEAKQVWNEDRSQTINYEVYQRWATSVLSILESIFGKMSSHHQNFRKSYDNFKWNQHDIESATGIFQAAKRDYEAGYLIGLENKLSGEIFGDFVTLAKHSLDEGHKDVAAVLASAALEDCLKRYAAANGIDVDRKTMQDVVGALKAKGLVSGAQKTLLESMPKVRDYSMHANWSKVSAADVGSIIGFVETFLLTHF